RFAGRLVVAEPGAEVGAEQVDVDGRVAVERGGVELHRADHACARFVVLAAVVDRGVVVRLDVGGVHADGVGDLGGGVDVDVGGVGDHAPEQGDVDRVAGVGDLLGPLLVLRILQERLDVGAPLHRQFGQAVAL